MQTKQFAYQLNECTYIANVAELVAFMQVSDDIEVLEHVFFCKFLKGSATGRAIFEVINNFISVNKNSNANGVNLMYRCRSSVDREAFRLRFVVEKSQRFN